MSILDFLKKFYIIIIAILAVLVTRLGVNYYIILALIGLLVPFLTNNKKGAITTAVLYATLSYILSYPSGLFLINYMPSTEIPIKISSSSVMINLFIGWLIPVIVTIIICGIMSIVSYTIVSFFDKRINGKNNEEHTFETIDDYNVPVYNPYEEYNNMNDSFNDYDNDYDSIDDFQEIDISSLDKEQKKELLYLTPIQKAKNRRMKKKDNW